MIVKSLLLSLFSLTFLPLLLLSLGLFQYFHLCYSGFYIDNVPLRIFPCMIVVLVSASIAVMVANNTSMTVIAKCCYGSKTWQQQNLEFFLILKLHAPFTRHYTEWGRHWGANLTSESQSPSPEVLYSHKEQAAGSKKACGLECMRQGSRQQVQSDRGTTTGLI